MTTTAKASGLFAAMAKAFPEIEGATKDSNNPHFKSKYADLSSVSDAIKPALTRHGLFFGQIAHEQTGGVCVETILCHESGESFSFGKLFVPASKNDAQGYGSALTYARRYGLMTAFGVCPEDDDGNAAVRAPVNDRNGEPATKPARPKPEALTGPMKTRAEARSKYGEIVRELQACADEDQLTAYLDTVNGEIAQFERELPEAWKGDGADFKGLRWEIDQARIACAQPDDSWKNNPLNGG